MVDSYTCISLINYLYNIIESRVTVFLIHIHSVEKMEHNMFSVSISNINSCKDFKCVGEGGFLNKQYTG